MGKEWRGGRKREKNGNGTGGTSRKEEKRRGIREVRAGNYDKRKERRNSRVEQRNGEKKT